MTALLDSNVLIATVVAEHVYHDAAEGWMRSWKQTFATCPITEGALVRFLVREGASARDALELLIGIHASDRHEFWPDDVSYTDVSLRGVIGHRQVTDAYLVALAQRRGGHLITFDKGLAAAHPSEVQLIDMMRR